MKNRTCKECGKEYNPTGKYQTLCNDCWKSARCGNSKKGNKECGKNSTLGDRRINLEATHFSLTKNARKLIKQRDEEIIKLNEISDSLAKENIRLRDEVKILRLR